MRRRVILAAALCFGASAPFAQTFGQDLNMGVSVELPRSPILTIEPDRLFSETQYGQRIQRELSEASGLLVDENREIEKNLATEELALTKKRPTLAHDVFRELANAFDLKVSSIRRRQDNKARALQQRRDVARQTFFTNIIPVLGDIVKESGAVAIVDRSTVFLTANEIDITTVAIDRMNNILGDGSTLRAAPTPAPAPPPATQAPTDQ